jgi:hypothetical protein
MRLSFLPLGSNTSVWNGPLPPFPYWSTTKVAGTFDVPMDRPAPQTPLEATRCRRQVDLVLVARVVDPRIEDRPKSAGAHHSRTDERRTARYQRGSQTGPYAGERAWHWTRPLRSLWQWRTALSLMAYGLRGCWNALRACLDLGERRWVSAGSCSAEMVSARSCPAGQARSVRDSEEGEES